MYISKVTLINYRNFKNSVFLFKKGINTIIGENGSGKSNVFKAIRLLLDNDLIKYAYELKEKDFNRSIGEWKGHWIIISIEFTELTSDESIQALFIHQTGDLTKSDISERATYNLFFRPSASVRAQLSALAEGDKIGLKSILSSLSIDDYETVFTGKSTANFSDPDVYSELVGDFENVKFNFEIDHAKFGIRIPHQLAVSKNISFTFIKALRDVVSDFHNNRTNPLLTLLKSKGDEADPSDFKKISDAILKLNSDIEKLDGVKEITNDIRSTIREAVGDTYSPSRLSIRSKLPEEPERLLQSLGLYIGEAEEDFEGEINDMSLGGANLIFLTLKLLEFKAKKKHERIAHFLLIEEPEAHLHTHIQKTLFDHISFDDTQVIYSTHSTFISEVSNIENVNILGRVRNYAEVFHPAAGLDSKSISKLQRYLDAIRTNLLFAKGVILVEGDGEGILYPTLFKKIYGLSLDELGISIVNIGSTGFENVAKIFNSDRIRRRCAIVTDLDNAYRPFAILNGDNEKEVSKKKHIRKAEVVGKLRHRKLKAFCRGNLYVRPFYANTTFEIELLEAGNPDEFCLVAKEFYASKNLPQMESELKSDDREIYGNRVLLLANGMKKGWFALSFSENVTWETFMPDYMINALIFAKGKFSRQMIADIVTYRINEWKKIYGIPAKYRIVNWLKNKFLSNQASINDLTQCVNKILGDVQLGYFLRKCEEYAAVGL